MSHYVFAILFAVNCALADEPKAPVPVPVPSGPHAPATTGRTAIGEALLLGTPAAHAPNTDGSQVAAKDWQGLPVPPENSKEKPSLRDSVFTGKQCRNRDRTIRTPETMDKPENYYYVHPNFKASVKPKGAHGVDVTVKSGPYEIKFSADKPSAANQWTGEAEVKYEKTARLPGFTFEQKDGVQTITYMHSRQPGYPIIFDDGSRVDDAIYENYEKVTSDGQYIAFDLYRSKDGKPIAYTVHSLCGDRFTAGGELVITSDLFNKMTPAKQKAFESLLAAKSDGELPPAPVAPNLAGLTPAEKRRALDKYLEELARHQKEVEALRAKLTAASAKPKPDLQKPAQAHAQLKKDFAAAKFASADQAKSALQALPVGGYHGLCTGLNKAGTTPEAIHLTVHVVESKQGKVLALSTGAKGFGTAPAGNEIESIQNDLARTVQVLPPPLLKDYPPIVEKNGTLVPTVVGQEVEMRRQDDGSYLVHLPKLIGHQSEPETYCYFTANR